MLEEAFVNHPYFLTYCEMNELNGGQYLFKTPEHNGMSVIRHDGSYGNELGLYEAGKFYWLGDTFMTLHEEPEGWLSVEEVIKMLNRMR